MRKWLGVVFILISVAARSCGSPFAPGIEVNSTETHPGATIRIDGWGFSGEAPFQIYLDGLNIANDTTNSAGGFHRIVTLSRRVALGLRKLSVFCGGESAETQVDIVQWPAWVSVVPERLRPGETLAIQGGGFPPVAYYEIFIGTTQVLSGATDGSGGMGAHYTIPKDTPVGSLVVEVNATMFSGPPSGMQSVEVVQWTPELEVSPSATNPGGMVTIDGWGFPPMGLYRILWDGLEILVDTTDRSGRLSRNYILPCDTAIGQHAIVGQAMEFIGPPSAVTQANVVQWPVELECQPPDGHPGSGVAFLGRNFPPRSPFCVSFDGAPIAAGNTTDNGELSASLLLPANLSLGFHEAIASVAGYAGPPKAVCHLNVTQWPLALSLFPSDPHPGSPISILGWGFPPNAPFEIQFDSSSPTLTGSSNGSGFIQSPYQLSRSISLGEHRIVCTVKGYSGPPRKGLIFIVTQWPVVTRILPVAHPGSAVHVIGEGYPPAEVYAVLVDDAQIGKGIVEEDGRFNASCALERGISLGTHQLRVETSMEELPPVSVSFLVSQWPARLRLLPFSGPSGTILSVNGSGFPPGSQVLVFFDGYCIKAAQSTRDGDFAAKMVVAAPQDESYHVLRAVATGGYTGDPQCVAYFWLGTGPPQMVVFACDEDGAERRSFFAGEVVNVAGSGYPPLVTMEAYILSGPASTPLSAIASVDVRSDEEGVVIPSRIAVIETPGAFRIWMDVNLNGIYDSNDVLAREDIAVLSRPDLALRGLWLSVQEAVQGQRISIRVNASNEGQVGSEGTLVVTHGDREVAVVPTGSIQPGATRVVSLDWDTSGSLPGTDALRVSIQQLPGETDVEDNRVEKKDFTIKPRPDISVSWLVPDSREVHKGKVVVVRVGLRNNGACSQVFSLHLTWGTRSIADAVVSLDAGLTRGFLFEWDTSDAIIGSEILQCTAEALAYERSPADNTIVNGSLTIQLPNRPPIADPHGPYQGEVSKAVTFDGTWSYDPDGTLILYRWDFGDGSFDYGGRVQHAYARAGSYDVALTVTDDDGDTGTATATASVGPGTKVHLVMVRILDAIKLSPVSGASVEMADASYESSTEPLSFEVREGTWALTASKAGYLTVRQIVIVDGDLSLVVEMMPIVYLFPCDALGGTKSDFASNEAVYAGLFAPDRYGVRIYVIGDGRATEGRVLEDVSSDGFELLASANGTVVTAVWPRPIPGSYDLVLDLDGNGVYDADWDVLESPYQPGFRIAEIGWIAMLICCLALARLGIGQ